MNNALTAKGRRGSYGNVTLARLHPPRAPHALHCNRLEPQYRGVGIVVAGDKLEAVTLIFDTLVYGGGSR